MLLCASLGLIQNGEDKDIKLIRDLVESYIQREDTIVLITIPMTGTFVLQTLSHRRRRFGIANCVNVISALLVKLLEQKLVCSPKTHTG
jgi:hypothetical protein